MVNSKKILHHLKLWIIISLVIVFSIHPTFAEQCNWATKDTFDMVYAFLGNVWKFLSRIWILLWNFAWVLMTNVMVYGEFMNLDTYLWKIWQLSRTIANYALWFIFIYYIFRYIFFKDEKPPTWKLKDILVASVLVQASRFIVMVLFDLSTIALATVSSFPSQVLATTPKMMENFKAEIWKTWILNDKKIVTINAFTDKYLESDNTNWYSIDSQWESTQWNTQWDFNPKDTTLDSLLPKPDNLWGPLVYLGASAFKAQDFTLRPIPQSTSCVDEITKVLTNLLLNGWTVILYSLSLAFLIILLIMRLWYLWVFIAISPIVILLYVLKIIKVKDDVLKLDKVIFLIFQPVVFSLWISLMFLVVVVIQWVFSTSIESYMSSVSFSNSAKSTTATDVWTKSSSLLDDSWIVSLHLKNWARSVKDIILSIITLVLMWQLVKLALSWSLWWFTWSKTISQKMNSLVTNTWKMIWSIWVVPTPTWMMWFNQVWDSSSGYSPLMSGMKQKVEGAFTSRDRSKETINAFLGKDNDIVVNDLTQTEKDNYFRSAFVNRENTNPVVFVETIKKIKDDKSGLRFLNISNEVTQWVKQYKDLEITNPKLIGNARYFGADDVQNWKNRISDDKFDVVKFFQDPNNNRYFQAFYEKVLGGKKDEYQNYSKFIENWWIVYKSTSESS